MNLNYYISVFLFWIMGTLVCPLCCGESFPTQESLKYHLLSVTDNIYCPDCGKRFDTIPTLAKHLNGFCGKDVDSEEEMDTKEEIIATLQQADGSHVRGKFFITLYIL